MNFIALQNTFSEIELALFINGTLKTERTASKIDASKDLIPFMQTMLEAHTLTLSDLSFIAVNKGPGPYTTLRTIIATVNGISFATGIPLIGIDGLDALLLENLVIEFPLTVALLNAFNNDVYFAIAEKNSITTKNCANYATFFDDLNKQYPSGNIHFVGDASCTYKEQITTIFGDRAHSALPEKRFASLSQIGAMARADFNTKKELSYQLQPIYLKKPLLFHQ